MSGIVVNGIPSDPEVEELLHEEEYAVLWATRRGEWGYCIDLKSGRDGHFRARAMRYTMLIGGEGKRTEPNDFGLAKSSLQEARAQIAEFMSFLSS